MEPLAAQTKFDCSMAIGDESLYVKNLAILKQRFPDLANRIESLAPDSEDPDFPGWRFNVRPAKNGQLTMYAINADSEIALHSTYDPAREATDLVNGVIGDGKRNYYVVLGMGMGYAVEKLLAEDDQDSKILVLEPFTGAVRKAFEVRDFGNILNDRRIVLCLGRDINTALALFLSRYELAFCRGVGFMELPARKRLPSDGYFAEFLERLKGIIITTGGNLQTLMTMAWTYQRNTMSSLRYVVQSPPVRMLFGKFQSKPGIIISAGPSLQKNIDQLVNVRDRAVLIAVDTSLKPLLNAGLEPHLICTGDPQEANWKHLRGAQTKTSYLVAEPMTYPLSIESFKQRLFIASYGDKVMQWIHKYIPDVGNTLCWGSVATMAFDLARKMGCDPIIFVGQDLSFPGGRTYVKGTYFEEEEKQDMSVEAFEKKHVTYTLTDIYGQPVKTNRQMFAYKEWFRTEFARTSARIVNATEGGILKEGCEIMPFKDAVDKYLAEEFDAEEIIKKAAQSFEGYTVQPLLKGLAEIIGSMKRCEELCNKGVARIAEVVKAVNDMDKLPALWCKSVIEELDGIRFKLREEPAMEAFLETANQAGVLNFQRAYRKINGKQFSRLIFMEALDLYTGLFMSMGRTARGVLPFFAAGFSSLSEKGDLEKIHSEDICLKTS